MSAVSARIGLRSEHRSATGIEGCRRDERGPGRFASLSGARPVPYSGPLAMELSKVGFGRQPEDRVLFRRFNGRINVTDDCHGVFEGQLLDIGGRELSL